MLRSRETIKMLAQTPNLRSDIDPPPSPPPGGSVGAAREMSPHWSQETVTCHSSNCFSSVWGQAGKLTTGYFSSAAATCSI